MLTCSRERSSGKPDMFNTADSRPLSPFSLLSLHRRSNREQSSPRISQHRWVRSGIYYILNEVICWTWILISVSRLWFSDFYIFASYNFPPSYFSPDTHRSPCIFHRIERPSDNASLLWIGFWIVVDWCFDPQLLCMLKTWRPNAEVAPVAALHCSSVCARVCVCACEWLNKKCILKSCVEQLRLKVQTNCILTSDHTANHWFPYFTSWMSALSTSRYFLLGLSLFLAAPSSLSCSQDTGGAHCSFT